MRRMLRGGTAVATAVAILAVVAVGGAYAATGGGGTITVCVHHHGGGLYRSRGRCARHDFKLSWNAAGQQGPAGSQGHQGPAGSPGPQGQPGPSGSALAWADVSPDGTVNASGGSSRISITHPSNGIYCVAVTPNPGFFAPVVASPTSENRGIIDVVDYEYSNACPGTYGVFTLLQGYSGSWDTTDDAFVVAVL